MAKMSEKMKQELKAEKAYNKKHKRMYRLTANDVIFNNMYLPILLHIY